MDAFEKQTDVLKNEESSDSSSSDEAYPLLEDEKLNETASEQETDRSATASETEKDSFDNEEKEIVPARPRYSVDICATCLVSKPPKLPLREELPSLGFELIYNARGVGAETSKYQSKRVVHNYRKKLHTKELEKRRIFPRSKKKIQKKLEAQAEVERELKVPTALSYQAYEYGLHHKGNDKGGGKFLKAASFDSTSTRSTNESYPMEQPYTIQTAMSESAVGTKRYPKKRWGFGFGGKKEQYSLLPEQQQEDVDQVFQSAAFGDLLAPVDTPEPYFQSHHAIENSQSLPLADNGPNSNIFPDFLFGELAETAYEDSVGATGSAQEDGVEPKTSLSLDNDVVNAMSGVNPAVYNQEQEYKEKNSNSNPFAKLFTAFSKSAKKKKTKKDGPVKNSPGSKEYNNSQEEIFDFLSQTDDENEQEEENKDEQDNESALQQEATMSWMETTRLALETVTSGTFGNTEEDEGVIASNNIWSWSAAGTIQEAASDFAKVTGLVPSLDEGDENGTDTKMMSIDDNPLGFRTDLLVGVSLLEVLGRIDCHAYEIQDAIHQSPELAQVKRQEDGRFPLHTLCARGMIDRTNVHESDLADFLLNDVIGYKECVSELVCAFPAAAQALDSNEDLPLHLLARTLMEWEACWYESVYTTAAREKNPDGKAAKSITSLYEAMSSCVEMLICPIAEDRDLCQVPGSVGQIYPLHIATIFTTSVLSLTSILESYPEAAAIPCDLDDLGTFIPDNALPIVLHNSLSTDFPKWEIERKKITEPNPFVTENKQEMRRSDLLFAYHPNIKPFRLDSARVKRMEEVLRGESKEISECLRTRLSPHMERFWVWLCTFHDPGSSRPAYSKSVKRVVKNMPLAAVRYLASILTPNGKSVLEEAAPKCAAAIQFEFERSPPVQIWERQARVARLLSNHKGFIAPFARTIFNIREKSFPTSFVILPYQLELAADGTLGVKDPEDFSIAAKFAECLLHLSDPRTILHHLDNKSKTHYGQTIYEGASHDDARKRNFSSLNAVEAKLLALYKPGSSFLYLLDEDSAMPVVATKEEPNGYPIVLTEPGSMVKKLLPLMLPGMVLMRGDKALSVLMNVILDSDVTVVPTNWVVAANNLSKFLSTRGNETFDDIDLLRDCVASFIHRTTSTKKRSPATLDARSEWSVESLTLKMLLETATSEPQYAGLRTIRNESWALYWTRLVATDISSVRDRAGMDLQDLTKKHNDLSNQFVKLSSIVGKDIVHSDSPIELESISEHEKMPLHSSSATTITPPLSFPNPPSEKPSVNRRLARLPHEITTVFEEEEEKLDDTAMPHTDIDERFNTLFDDLSDYDGGNIDHVDNTGAVQDGPEVTQLKVLLEDQARKSGDLSKRVHELTSTTERFMTKEDEIQEHALGRKRKSRKPLIRLGDLEERLLSDAIDIQHLTTQSLSMYYQVDEIDVTDESEAEQNGQKPSSPVVNLPKSTKSFPSHLSSLTGSSNGPPRVISTVQKYRPRMEAPLSPATRSTRSTKSASTSPGSAENPVWIVSSARSVTSEAGSCPSNPLNLAVVHEKDGSPVDLTSFGGRDESNSIAPSPSLAGSSVAYPLDLTDQSGTTGSWIKYHDSTGQIEL